MVIRHGGKGGLAGNDGGAPSVKSFSGLGVSFDPCSVENVALLGLGPKAPVKFATYQALMTLDTNNGKSDLEAQSGQPLCSAGYYHDQTLGACVSSACVNGPPARHDGWLKPAWLKLMRKLNSLATHDP